MRFSRVVGTTSLRMRSRNTAPGPTDGSWSKSPTRTRRALGGKAASALAGRRDWAGSSAVGARG